MTSLGILFTSSTKVMRPRFEILVLLDSIKHCLRDFPRLCTLFQDSEGAKP